ncbi:MAG: class I SAM-dependent methyltransferase [Rhodospirillales bacterium]
MTEAQQSVLSRAPDSPAESGVLTPLQRRAYRMSQAATAGLFIGQKWLSARLTRPVKSEQPIEGGFPSSEAVLADLRALFLRDLRNADAGLYPLPDDLLRRPLRALGGAAGFFADLPAVERRRHAGAGQEVFRQQRRPGLPRYYQQNFHFQSDGWFSRSSARRYDHQVEVLFTGGADAMRRQALVPLAKVLKGRSREDLRLLDLGSGSGGLLPFLKATYPRLRVLGLDLSLPYLQEAAARLSPYRRWQLLQAPAEDLPLAAASIDAVTCVFLFHELPRKVRAQVVAEAARVLKPGGSFLLVDSIQKGDVADYDGLLDYFPVAFHEPYYADYVRQDLEALFAKAGFRQESVEVAYFSRVMHLVKQG